MNGEIEFKSDAIDLLRVAAQDEYGNEQKRTAIIDSKAGIALPIIAAFFLALAEMNDYRSFLVVPITSVLTLLIPMFKLISYTASLIMAFLSVIWMARVVYTREYSTINPRELYNDDYLKNDARVLSLKFLHLYFEATEHNRKENNERVKLYQQSWGFTFISVSCFVVYIILKNNFI